MFLLIVMSSITLAVENPLHDPESTLAKSLVRFDKIFAVVFLFEMVTKVIALGLVLNSGAYLRSPWNVIDAFVAVSSAVLLLANISTLTASSRRFYLCEICERFGHCE